MDPTAVSWGVLDKYTAFPFTLFIIILPSSEWFIIFWFTDENIMCIWISTWFLRAKPTLYSSIWSLEIYLLQGSEIMKRNFWFLHEHTQVSLPPERSFTATLELILGRITKCPGKTAFNWTTFTNCFTCNVNSSKSCFVATKYRQAWVSVFNRVRYCNMKKEAKIQFTLIGLLVYLITFLTVLNQVSLHCLPFLGSVFVQFFTYISVASRMLSVPVWAQFLTHSTVVHSYSLCSSSSSNKSQVKLYLRPQSARNKTQFWRVTNSFFTTQIRVKQLAAQTK
jgi:hypothetical protein